MTAHIPTTNIYPNQSVRTPVLLGKINLRSKPAKTNPQPYLNTKLMNFESQLSNFVVFIGSLYMSSNKEIMRLLTIQKLTKLIVPKKPITPNKVKEE